VEMLDVKELAQRLNVPRSQVYRLAELGKLPVVRVGKYLRFPWPEILRHLSGGVFGEEDDGSSAAEMA